jgi:hypothetical protein
MVVASLTGFYIVLAILFVGALLLYFRVRSKRLTK